LFSYAREENLVGGSIHRGDDTVIDKAKRLPLQISEDASRCTAQPDPPQEVSLHIYVDIVTYL